ncbi:MAG TPA: cation-transporting P-type ATPase, partial [Candidatus Macondimonas sp.]|nr:cation-transporting P-type ATPase [Candidatus Macondimonas sp.]
MTSPDDSPPFHALTTAQVLDRLEATAAGLSQTEAARRREHYGPNRLPEAPRRHPLLRFLAHFHNVLIYV